MLKKFRIKKELKHSIPNLQPELEMVDTIEIEARTIPPNDGFDINEIPFEKKTYYSDKNGILYPERILDLYYEEME